MNARAMLSLLLHGDKALDVVRTARKIGVIPILDAGPVALRELADATGTRPLRLYKFLDVLENIGLIAHERASDDLMATSLECPMAQPRISTRTLGSLAMANGCQDIWITLAPSRARRARSTVGVNLQACHGTPMCASVARTLHKNVRMRQCTPTGAPYIRG